MRYSKSELRKTHRPLLRRVQRQVEKKQEIKKESEKRTLKIPMKKGSYEKIGSEKSKLYLYDKRRGR